MVEKKHKKESAMNETAEEHTSRKKSHPKKTAKTSAGNQIEELEKKLEAAQEDQREL